LSKYYNLFNSDNDNENSLKNKIEQKDLLTNFLIEDIGTGDITSNILIDETIESNAQIICKNDGNIIISGLEEAKSIFEICNCNCTLLNNDGDIIKKNKTIVMEIQGSAKSILKAERTALNLIMHMSGISTKTYQFIKEIGEYSNL